MTAINTVPAHYVGLWRRESLQRGLEPVDTSSLVFWIQTLLWHADIRVPAGRPDFRGARSLEDCSETQLGFLLRQEAFWGVTVVEGDRCHWNRMLDFQYMRTQDFGRMVFEDDQVYEQGVASDYHEKWQRVSKPEPSVRSYIATGPNSASRAVICIADKHFIFIRPRAIWDVPAMRIQSRIEAGTATRAEWEAFLNFEASFGEIAEGHGVVTLSTLPWRESQVAFVDGDHRRFDAQGYMPLDRFDDALELHADVFKAAATLRA